MESRMQKAPVELPDELSQVDQMEYVPVRLVGTFDHSRELVVAPRGLMREKKGGAIVSNAKGNGAHVVTPLKLADRDVEVLVNRGWVPKPKQNPATRREGQVEGAVEVTGIVRLNEKRPPFVQKNNPESNRWNYRDVNGMAELLGTAPIYVEATLDSEVPGGPIAGQTNVNVRNEHLSYIFTWFSLSALTSYAWYRQFVRQVFRR